jgi:hypothetical protein
MLSKTKIKLLSLFLIILLSASTIAANKGFYYSDLQNSINVKFGNRETGIGFDIEELDTAQGLGNTARVDEANFTITYQHESEEDITQKLNEKFNSTDFLVMDTSEQLEMDDYLSNLTVIMISLLATSLLTILYLRYRRGITNQSIKFILKTYGSFVLMIAITGFLTIGALSMLSRIYMLTVTDAYSPIISMGIFTLLFNYVAVISKRDEVNDLLSKLNKLSDKLIKLLIFVLLLVLPIIVGLGSNFIYPGIIILLAIIIPVLTIESMTSILMLKEDKLTTKSKGLKTTTSVDIPKDTKTNTSKKIVQKSRNKKQNKGRK